MIERYMALNSLFLLPALDVQFGAIQEQPLGEEWTLYAGLFNENGRAADNLSDNNGDKEVQLKVRHDYSENFTWSLSLDCSNEESPLLNLEGYSFTNYDSVPVEGTRRFNGGSFDYTSGPVSLRGEGLYADFADAGAHLVGGYLQPAYFQYGDRTGGLQYLLRADVASIGHDERTLSGGTIRALTVGVNWYVNGNLRLKLNAVGEDYDGPGNNTTPTTGVQGEGLKPYLLTELQLKFRIPRVPTTA